MNFRMSLPARGLAGALLLALAPKCPLSSAAEPSWTANVVTPPHLRRAVAATPIEQRPYRPFHVYGNTVRRLYYHDRLLPTPWELAHASRVLVRRETAGAGRVGP